MMDELRAHPIATGIMVAATLVGAALGPMLGPDDWSVVRKLAAGAVGGLGVGFIVVFTHIIGAYDDFKDSD